MKPACGSIRRARPLLGTFVEIAVADAPASAMEKAVEEAFAAIAEVHRLMSLHKRESDLSRLNSEAALRPVEVHPWTFEVLQAAVDLQHRSAGFFNAAAALGLPREELLPRGREDSAAPHPIELLPCRRVRFSAADTRIDLGGIAKGFAVDRAVFILRDRGMRRGLVNAGGDLAAFGPDAVSVCVRDSRDPRCVICRVDVKDEALASSGRPLESSQCNAVLDPRTGLPASAALGATVCADRCMLADALTKVVMIAGEAAAPMLASYRASALFVAPDGDLRVSRNWQHAVHLAA